MSNVHPLRRVVTAEQYLVDDDTPIPVHLILTPHELNLACAYLEHPTAPEHVRAVGGKIIRQVRS